MRLLFVCVENSCRSQMAEGFASAWGADAWSAGSKPSGVVNPKAIAAMAEVGIDLSTHRSQSVEDVAHGTFDAVVTMGCGDACPAVAATRVRDWDLPDPKHMDPVAFGAVRDRIRAEVVALIEEIKRDRDARDPT